MLTAFKKSLLCCFTGTDKGPVTQYLDCQLNAYSALSTGGMLTQFRLPGLRLIRADCPSRDAIDPALHLRYRSIVRSIGFLFK